MLHKRNKSWKHGLDALFMISADIILYGNAHDRMHCHCMRASSWKVGICGEAHLCGLHKNLMQNRMPLWQYIYGGVFEYSCCTYLSRKIMRCNSFLISVSSLRRLRIQADSSRTEELKAMERRV